MARIADPGDSQRHLEALNTGKTDYTQSPIKFNTIKFSDGSYQGDFSHDRCCSYCNKGEINSELSKLKNQHPSSTFYVFTLKTVAHHRTLSPHLWDADKLSWTYRPLSLWLVLRHTVINELAKRKPALIMSEFSRDSLQPLSSGWELEGREQGVTWNRNHTAFSFLYSHSFFKDVQSKPV